MVYSFEKFRKGFKIQRKKMYIKPLTSSFGKDTYTRLVNRLKNSNILLHEKRPNFGGGGGGGEEIKQKPPLSNLRGGVTHLKPLSWGKTSPDADA